MNVIIFKSYLDLHLSESDWCRFVVRFWQSYDPEKRFGTREQNRTKILHPRLGMTLECLPESRRFHRTLI